MKKAKIETKTILNILFFMYLLGAFVCNSGKGFDWFFSRASFVVLIIAAFILRKRNAVTGLLKMALVFWGYYFLSMIWASDYRDTISQINSAIKILGLFLYIPLIIEDRKDIEKVLKTIISALIVTCIIVLIKTPLEEYGSSRLGNIVGLNRNRLGMITASGFLFSLYFIKEIFVKKEIVENKQKEIKNVIIYILFAVLFLSIALLTGSRKALLLAILGYAFFEFLTMNRKKFPRKIMIMLAFFTIVFIAIFAVPQVYKALGVRIIKNIQMITGTLEDRSTDTSLQARNFFISKAIILFKENPILGYGGNNFITYMREIEHKNQAYSHNNFWELLSTLGIIGFVIYYGFWLSVIYKNIKIYKKTKDRLTLIILINLILLVFLDYWVVSYILDFNAIILALGYLNILIYEKEKVIKHFRI